MPRVKLEVTPEPTVTKQMLSTAICKLSDATNELLNSGMNQTAIVVLLVDKTKLSKRRIQMVLDAIGQLRADYTL